jgi:RNA polymerase sigma-70 factor, ECF subfamily
MSTDLETLAGPNAFAEITAVIREAETRYGQLPRDRLATFLLSRLEGVVDPEPALRKLRIADLCLAFMAGEGHTAATAELEQIIRKHCAGWIRATGSDPNDVMQQALSRLLVPEEGAARRILEYRGMAPLSSFLRIICTRMAISIARKTLQESNLSLSYEVVAPGNDLELDALRARYREPFTVAMREALRALSPRNKTLLKLHFAKGVQVAALATMYNIHRVSMSRWIAEAKEELFTATKEGFKAEVHVTDSEFQSVLRVMRSELDLRLSTLREDEIPSP